MPYGLQTILDTMQSQIRTLERKVETAELRDKQLIVMLKMILDKSKGKNNMKVRMVDIINWMEGIVQKNLTDEEKRVPADLVSELVKKGMKSQELFK